MRAPATRPVAAPEPGPADQLRRLAHRLEHLGRGCRGDPSLMLEARDAIAHELRRLARSLDPSPRGGGR